MLQGKSERRNRVRHHLMKCRREQKKSGTFAASNPMCVRMGAAGTRGGAHLPDDLVVVGRETPHLAPSDNSVAGRPVQWLAIAPPFRLIEG